MKKLILGLAALLCTIPCVSNADFVPYVGVDAQYRSVLLRDIPHNMFTKAVPAYAGYAGVRWDWIGAEAGAHAFSRKHKGDKVTGHGFHLSVVGYLDAHEYFDVIGMLGINHVCHKHETPWYWIKIKGPNPRLGVGFEVKVNDYIAWRNMALWESKVTLRNVSTIPRGSMGLSSGLKLSF